MTMRMGNYLRVIVLCLTGLNFIILYKPVSIPEMLPVMKNFKSNITMYSLKQNMEFEQGSKCSCLEPTIRSLDMNTRHRQKREYMEWERQENKMAEPMTLCPAMSPIRYLGSGITVEPLSSVRVVGIEVDSVLKASKHLRITLTSRNSLGHIYVEPFTMTDLLHIEGNNSGQISMQTENIDQINSALSHLIYTGQQHHIRQRDYIDVSMHNFHIVINIVIQRSHVPRLYDPGPYNNISGKVTIVSKTFERYECVKRLISSVRTFYPNIKIIIADDSCKKQKLDGNNVKHFLMPFLEGYNAGKNLLVSQVRTKYFLWVDDDYVFTSDTILERFVEKLESPTAELDLVAGLILHKGVVTETITKDAWSHVEYAKGKDSGCIMKRTTTIKTLKEFPNCKLKDMVTNFFMAKTEAVRKVGFDLTFERFAHREFFVDALGYLRIAQCDDVIILHRREADHRYSVYRHMKHDTISIDKYAKRILFKNNLQCFQSWEKIFLLSKNNNE
ncbi:beta-1,4 N-acetylgalactosaminyltransferase 1-like [Saccoglossus kowalevskii]|uniref:Beta-1,4 N-acetylgalactosaminyltransferase 1-like n=1 Tax=Saccoglossus kowalevskii TaxID=10224 RepID=A0ABM0GM86_SACKO|nr:PREDICTED: beta-1,4 N-acetylgalactosaminyltransferase 1-like [Saccoglossus kowalevskii]